MRTLLTWLSAGGWTTHTMGATLFDGFYEYPREQLFGASVATQENVARFVRLEQDGVQHTLLYTQSTQAQNLKREEALQLLRRVDSVLTALKPDVVVGYGADAVSRKLWEIARRHARSLAFYLSNTAYDDADMFKAFDYLLCPSSFLAKFYNERLGLQPTVITAPFANSHFAPPNEVTPVAYPETRRNGFITFINPSPIKGVSLVVRLIRLAKRLRPEWTFLCVEGRVSAEETQRAGADIASMPNAWWLPNQQDIRPVYRRTSALLFPSFCLEASGRAIAEAQLGHIPVLATRRGGIPDQLHGGGFLFDVPEVCAENYGRVPSEDDVRPWFNTLCKLMDDDTAYADAVQRARRASESFHPDHAQPRIAILFNKISEGQPLNESA